MKSLKAAVTFIRKEQKLNRQIMIDDINNTKRHRYKSQQDLIEYLSRNYNISNSYAKFNINKYKNKTN